MQKHCAKTTVAKHRLLRTRRIMKGLTLINAAFLISCQAPTPKSDKKSFDSIAPLEIEYSVAVQFINDYVAFLADRSRTIGPSEWVDNRSDVTADFKLELKRILAEADQEPPRLGFDPILDAQDYPSQMEVDQKEDAYVTVKGIDWPAFRLTLRLAYEKGAWLVDGSGVVNVPVEKRAER